MRPKKINKNLALLLGGQFISQIGDKFYALALSFWVLRTTGSAAQMGVVLFASMAPSIVLGFFVGGIIDRRSRKAILVAADLARAAVVAAVIALYYLGTLNLGVIVAAQVLLSCASAFFNPAVLAVVPQIVPEEGLVKANSLSQFLSGAANIVGPALGGLAVAGLGYGFVFAVNALSFLASALCAGMLKIPREPGAGAEKKPAAGALRAGYAYILARRRILAMLAVVAVVHFFAGSVQVVMPVLANSLPGDGASTLGYLESAFGFGIVAAAALLRLLNKKGGEAGMFSGLIALGAVQAATGLLYCLGVLSVPVYIATFFLLSAAVIVTATNYTVILQRTIDNDMAGRVFAIVGSVGNLTVPVAVLLAGCVVTGATLGVVTAACGAAIIMVCGALALAWRAQKITLTA